MSTRAGVVQYQGWQGRFNVRIAESTEGSRGSPQIMASFFIVERSVVIVDDRGCRELFLTVVGQKKTYFFGR